MSCVYIDDYGNTRKPTLQWTTAVKTRILALHIACMHTLQAIQLTFCFVHSLREIIGKVLWF